MNKLLTLTIILSTLLLAGCSTNTDKRYCCMGRGDYTCSTRYIVTSGYTMLLLSGDDRLYNNDSCEVALEANTRIP